MKITNKVFGVAAALLVGVVGYNAVKKHVREMASEAEINSLAATTKVTDGLYQCGKGFSAAEWNITDMAKDDFLVIARANVIKSGNVVDTKVYVDSPYAKYFPTHGTQLSENIYEQVNFRTALVMAKCGYRDQQVSKGSSGNLPFSTRAGFHFIINGYKDRGLDIRNASVFTDYNFRTFPLCDADHGYQSGQIQFFNDNQEVASASVTRAGNKLTMIIHAEKLLSKSSVSPERNPAFDELGLTSQVLLNNDIQSCNARGATFVPASVTLDVRSGPQ